MNLDFVDDTSTKVLAVTFRAGKRLTAAAFRKALSKAARELKQHQQVGDQNFKKFSGKERDLTGVDVSGQAAAAFRPYARQNGISYSLVQHKNDPERYTLYFPARDLVKFQFAVDDFMKDTEVVHDSLDEKLNRARQEAFRINEARRQEREKNRAGRENSHESKQKRQRPDKER